MDLFAAIADERRELADVLAGLTPDQLRTPSLCPPWTVHEVAAHLVTPFLVSMPRALLQLVACGFNFDRWAERLAAGLAVRPTADLVLALREHAHSRFVPPGSGPGAPLVEILVHGLDIRWPLHLARSIPEDRARVALDFLAKAPARGHTRDAWRRGLRFECTDLDWAYGDGPLVRGTTDAVLLALTGRRQALDVLEGDGVAMLRRRFGSGQPH